MYRGTKEDVTREIYLSRRRSTKNGTIRPSVELPAQNKELDESESVISKPLIPLIGYTGGGAHVREEGER